MLNCYSRLDYVAAFAATSGNVGFEIHIFVRLVCYKTIIRRFVKRVSRIVSHAAVNRDITLVTRNGFDVSDGVKRNSGSRNKRTSRLKEHFRFAKSVFPTIFLYIFADMAKHIVNVEIFLLRHISYAESSAEVEYGRLKSRFFLDVGYEFKHNVRSVEKRFRIKTLRAYVAVIAQKLYVSFFKRRLYKFKRLPRFNRFAEL